MQFGEHSSVLTVDTDEIAIDLDDFESILNLAKLHRVKVTINIANGSNALNGNRKWLEVKIKREFERIFEDIL